jgi:hypothetical protein
MLIALKVMVVKRGAPPTFCILASWLTMEVNEYLERFRTELDTVVRFWVTNSHDRKHGYVCPGL